jgi:deazaflavin-dependent oxidoreductase (nitroreductase family)
MDEQIRRALAHDQVIDITTTGRRSGLSRRIEIRFHNVDGTIYLSGLPGKRDWYANLCAHPDFTFHLKQSIQADLPAHATPIVEEGARQAILARIVQDVGRAEELEEWVAHSPLVEVRFK